MIRGWNTKVVNEVDGGSKVETVYPEAAEELCVCRHRADIRLIVTFATVSRDSARNLTAAEIIGQVFLAASRMAACQRFSKTISHQCSDDGDGSLCNFEPWSMP